MKPLQSSTSAALNAASEQKFCSTVWRGSLLPLAFQQCWLPVLFTDSAVSGLLPPSSTYRLGSLGLYQPDCFLEAVFMSGCNRRRVFLHEATADRVRSWGLNPQTCTPRTVSKWPSESDHSTRSVMRLLSCFFNCWLKFSWKSSSYVCELLCS